MSFNGVGATRRHCFEFTDPKRRSSESGFPVHRQYILHCETLHVLNAVVYLVAMFGDSSACVLLLLLLLLLLLFLCMSGAGKITRLGVCVCV